MNLVERETIYLSLSLRQTQAAIAKLLDRHKSSISREIARCKQDPLGYLPDRAEGRMRTRLRRNQGLFRSSWLKEHVIECLKLGHTPEQIAGRLKLANSAMRVSHETIYKFIYSDEGIKLKLSILLTRQKPKRSKWYGKKPKKSHIPESASIAARPLSIEKRKTKGHFEGDLVIFRAVKSANVTTIVERKSRFVQLIYNRSKYTKDVIGGIKNALFSLPKSHLKTITFDRGTEFASFAELNLPTFFCDPHSPWQKGSNENFNGRLRRYLPKSFNPAELSQKLLDKIADNMNNCPRKCLGFKTPAEVFHSRPIRHVALDP